MGSRFVRDTAVIDVVPYETHVGYEGYAVVMSGGKSKLVTGDTDIPIGIIVDGEATTGTDAIAVCDGACGTVRVKLDATPGTVVVGTYLTITSSGTFRATTSGDTCCARALEIGAASELVEAVLFRPYVTS